ncbi:molybdenum ABC transporter ATP-binding protein [Pseudodonghicola flavimaris]|uniref:Molybdenum ABC transporter ATP-binding protein n=1 Tax=Pseudodonghicola flavimaris TaxID=3050036 RepID=A0ABT7EZ25_9RHOB|nr:molybdenum ABC transporter ATP-binding protein [Pseudodonghicola flavimaris]MDK3017592.1 molybdenum ABC transporter ATP-binding protein [Pseudodonghicola flavimaris]
MSLTVDIAHPLAGFDLNVAFEAPEGVTALFGRSGAGKTTVINAVAGLLKPERGRILLGGETLFDATTRVNLPVHRRRLGYVFQDGRLFPHLSVKQNLMYGRRFAPRGAKGPDLAEVADLLGLSTLLERRPGALSGGEKQRVAIGRALLSRPRLLLMDEPLAALDAARKDEILPYLERLRDRAGLPILYVSHSVAEVARLATSVVVLEAGQVVRAGPAEQVLSDPGMVHQIGLREAGAVLTARIAAHHGDGLSELQVSGGRLFLPHLDQPVGAQTRVRILAQDVMLATEAPRGVSALNILEGEVVTLRDGSGPGAIVQLRCGGDLLLSRITRRSAEVLRLAPGTRIFAVVKTVSIARSDVGAG